LLILTVAARSLTALLRSMHRSETERPCVYGCRISLHKLGNELGTPAGQCEAKGTVSDIEIEIFEWADADDRFALGGRRPVAGPILGGVKRSESGNAGAHMALQHLGSLKIDHAMRCADIHHGCDADDGAKPSID